MSYHFALAAASPLEEPAPLVCPECSYLKEGSCIWCPDDADMPGCAGCVKHQRAQASWLERSGVLTTMGVAVVTTVVATIVTTLAMRKLRMKKAA